MGRTIRGLAAPAACMFAMPVLTGCEGAQSVLDPAGKDAAILADLFWVLLAGAAFLWLAVNGLFYFVTRIRPRPMRRTSAQAVVIAGGIVFPLVILTALLAYSLSIMPDQRAAGTAEVEVRVTGEQWWWRVEYLRADGGEPIVAANEIRLPADARTEVRLGADKVIHSFWIPSLAGKVDMFPGRETRIALEPQKPGIYRGQCAEFCGTSHALMALYAVVMPPADFEEWLHREAGPAVEPVGDEASRGRDVFLSQGCAACHAIRGTDASGQTGPDLTHVGSRQSLGAGTLPQTREDFMRWIRHTDSIKPDVAMPSFRHLSQPDLRALATYLHGLK